MRVITSGNDVHADAWRSGVRRAAGTDVNLSSRWGPSPMMVDRIAASAPSAGETPDDAGAWARSWLVNVAS